MAHLKFERDHNVDMNDGKTKTYPAGWSGVVDDADVVKDALEKGNAIELFAKKAAPIEIPEGYDKLSAADVKDLAVRLGAGEDVKTKDDAIAFIDLVAHERAEAAAPKT